MTSLTIVTGASRGLGRAIAEQLHAAGHRVLGLSRNVPDAPFEQWACDLAEPLPVALRLEQWLATLDTTALRTATLINNAAIVTAPQSLAEADARALSAAVRVGLEAPLLLTSAFLRATRRWSAQRRVLHISSGLGRRGMASAGPYCAVKAGLDNLARAQVLEEGAQPNGAKVCSLAPGVIDTAMQVQLRSADARDFPDVAVFAQMKSAGRLDSPAVAAAKVIAYLARADFGTEPIGDVRDP